MCLLPWKGNAMTSRSNSLLIGLPGVMALLVVTAFGISASAQTKGKDGVADVAGARWHYEITNGADKKPVEKGVFRVNEKVIYKGKDKVGLIKAQSRTETTLIIEHLPEINGTAKLKKVSEKPPIWEGTLERKGGKHFKMRVEFRDS
jgi:hypothetical protein